MTTIRWSNGERDQTFETLGAARDRIERDYPFAVYGEPELTSWDQDGERILVWLDRQAAGPEGLGDDGSHAIAEILT
jgi:hypothetical protein